MKLIIKLFNRILFVLSNCNGECKSEISDNFITTDKDYDRAMKLHHRRITRHTLTSSALIKQCDYNIGGMKYKVNSIFSSENKGSSDDAIKLLITNDVNKNM